MPQLASALFCSKDEISVVGNSSMEEDATDSSLFRLQSGDEEVTITYVDVKKVFAKLVAHLDVCREVLASEDRPTISSLTSFVVGEGATAPSEGEEPTARSTLP